MSLNLINNINFNVTMPCINLDWSGLAVVLLASGVMSISYILNRTLERQNPPRRLPRSNLAYYYLHKGDVVNTAQGTITIGANGAYVLMDLYNYTSITVRSFMSDRYTWVACNTDIGPICGILVRDAIASTAYGSYSPPPRRFPVDTAKWNTFCAEHDVVTRDRPVHKDNYNIHVQAARGSQ